MRRSLGAMTLLAWILWAQSHGLVVLNNKVMVDAPRDGIWRYVDAYDGKSTCWDAVKTRLADQETMLATLTPTSDLSKLTYQEYRCYPESVDPTQLTRGGWE